MSSDEQPPAKRAREEAALNGNAVEDDEEDDDMPLVPQRTTQRKVVPGEQCPYLDTISRQVRAAWSSVVVGTAVRKLLCG